MALRRRWKIILWTVAATVFAIAIAANFARPEKKLERTVAHRYTVAEPQFRREMGVMLGPGLTTGNHVDAYDNGDEIFPPMLAAIASAEHTINFETYIYWSGDVGRKFAEALAERARAGVRVNVIIDWVGGLKMENDLLALMQDAGADVQLYRPLRWYNLSRLNNRTHRKLLIVDGHTGFTGGVGIADVWGGSAQDPDHWRDMHFRARGPVVAQMQAAFNDNWIKATGEVLNGAEYFPPLTPVGDMDAHMFISSPAGGSESMHLMYLMAIAAADRTLDIHASYFVPDELAVYALRAALKRGVRVRVLVPGEHIDSETVRIAFPLVGDAHATGEADLAVHDQQLAVRAVVQAAQVVPAQRAVLVHFHAGGLHFLQQRVLHLDAAGPVQHHLDLDPGARTFRQRIGERLADVAGPVDVGFEGDGALRGSDRVQHGREDLVSVLQVGDLVAGGDAGPQHHAHLAPELRVGHRVAVLDLALQRFLGGLEIHRHDDRQHGQQRGDDNRPGHALAAPALRHLAGRS